MTQHVLKRQLRRLARLNRMVQKLRHGNRRGIGHRMLRLTERLKRLGERILRQPALRQVPGAMAFVLGLGFSTQADAQIQFSDPQVSPFGLTQSDDILIPILVDIDGDGDLDVFTSSYPNYVLYTNTGDAENPAFNFASIVNPFGLTPDTDEGIGLGAFADMDGDGDLDFLAGEYNVYKYYENTGTAQAPQYGTPLTNPFGLTAPGGEDYIIPTLADFDNDGDADLLLGGYNAAYYYENTGSATTPQFGGGIVDPFNLDSSSPIEDGESYVFYAAGDVDGDGDLDLIQGQYYGIVRYFENTGTAEAPDFAAPVDNPFGIVGIGEGTFILPTLGDLDSDGDVDLLTGQYLYDETGEDYAVLVYYQNITGDLISVQEVPGDFELAVSPNPATDQLQIRTNYALTGVALYDATGRLVLEREGTVTELSVDQLPQGVYQLQVRLRDGSLTTERVAIVR